jgi:ABC-type transport system substrate-binding protein
MKRLFALLAAFFVALLLPIAPAWSIGPQIDPHKVLRTMIPQGETGFDPAKIHDLYSNTIAEALYEALLTYDYLARPAQLAPRTAASLPEVGDGGRSYTFRLRQGVHFVDDPAFGGRKRELTAADYAYSIKRLMDPAVRSPYRMLIDGKIEGLDALTQQAERSGRFDYDAPVSGLAVPDRYTLRITLTAPDYNFAYILAMPTFGAVAREVIERYGQDSNAHPVGTGPYRLGKWVRASQIDLIANPDYRGVDWNYAPGEPADEALVKEMKGKVLPTIGRIQIAVMEEDQAHLLAFQNRELDLFELRGGLAPRVLDGAKLRPEYVAMGARLSRIVDPELAYLYFNMRQGPFAGLTKDKIALRRAIALAYDADEEIRTVWNGQATRLEFPIPPGIVGYLPDYRSSNQTDVPLANALLDLFGYQVGADGWRTMPDGKPLEFRFATVPDSEGRLLDEHMAKTLGRLKIRMVGEKRKFADMLKAEKACQVISRPDRWIADYPDGDNFMQLFYSKNIGQSNTSCTEIPEYDRLYERASKLPAGPAREALYVDMARLLEYYAAIKPNLARNRNMIMQPRVLGYKKHPFLLADWLYIDLDDNEEEKKEQ